ncbi:TROVE domain-containing protein [Caldanaerobacter subterraneus]|uniref:TROVE domain-containing protein n=1 Tax=Caldanaerobacter subterraneus TaxID=911092 RepID=A0A7Y2PNA2_9THEO|nr:TROVE domain-containing protein [Caldanaerobacter subterraneus]NNG67541.1 TROVE domain-containing protein [Caldanaerobacter subterraneus]
MSRAKQLFSTKLPDTVNRDGYPAYTRSLEEQYLQTLLTNTIGNTFYADSDTLLTESNEIHDAMLEKNPEFAAKALIFARNKGLMRLQPILGLVKLSSVSQKLFSNVFSQVILIPSDLQDFMTILKGQGRGQGGRAIKRQAALFLNNISEYWAIKYNGRGRGYSLGDIVKTVHPKPINDKQRNIFAYLVGKDYDKTLLPQITAYERLKRTTNVKEQIALIQEGKLPHEIVTGVVKPNREIWNAILYQMPIFALLRNLNTLDRAGVLDENREYIVSVLNDPERLAKSKILPFRFVKAFQEVEKAWMKDVLRYAVELTFNNLPEIPGKTAVFLDVSGSMEGDYLRIGSVFALALYKKTKGNSIFWTFDTSVYDPQPSIYDSILTQAEKIKARGGTDTGAPVRKLIEDKVYVDNIIIITDEQQNTGSPFYRELERYRQSINPSAKAFVIDIAPYRSAMVPPTDTKTHYIYGWSEIVLHYIAMSIQGFDTMIDEVNNMKI